MTANITQWPSRSGPSTLPAIAAPKNASAATPAMSAISPALLRQVSHGRDSSSEHREPGDARHRDQIDLDAAEQS